MRESALHSNNISKVKSDCRFVQKTAWETASPAEGQWEETFQSLAEAVAAITMAAAGAEATGASSSTSEGEARNTTAWAGA